MIQTYLANNTNCFRQTPWWGTAVRIRPSALSDTKRRQDQAELWTDQNERAHSPMRDLVAF